ncbi:glucose/galactose MFS transporter [Acetobacter senegalensis]|uniref:glucose/galactose MFS transporter n=1 Tax=Acetobacter senegalensis TaxID=446692 RepID=UPI00264A6923|nr:glucose/galactose MFS transporter [Acetobacter senegalensis]MDN7355248.1 glucose/galactose MFS transporter [Acetobacter senegalensis]
MPEATSAPAPSPTENNFCPAGSYGWTPLCLTAMLFFLIGFVTWLNGPLISFVRVSFSLDDISAFLIPLVFYFSYFFFAIPASWVIARTGLKRGLSLALTVMAMGMACTGQFIAAGVYEAALVGLLILGGGLALLQVAVNPYVSFLGPPQKAAQRIAIMGICNKFAGILAPIVLATLVMGDIENVARRAAGMTDAVARSALLSQFVQAIYWPYLGMALLMLLAAGGVALSSLPDLQPPEKAISSSGLSHASDTRRTLLSSHVLCGIAAMFLYVGVEVMAGDAIGTYAQGFGLPLSQTRFFTALTLTGMLVGYCLGMVCTPRFCSQERYTLYSCLAGSILSLLAFVGHGYGSVLCIALLGVANAMIFPGLFPTVLKNTGKAAPLVSAFLVMAYCGGGILPQLFVWLKTLFGFQGVFTSLTLCGYALIALYMRRSAS